MRILLPLALLTLSAQAMTTTSTNAAPEAPRAIVGSYRFLGFFCGDVPVQVDVGGSIGLEVTPTSVVMSSSYGSFANDQFLTCRERTESKIIASQDNLLVVQPGKSVTECLDTEGNVERQVTTSEGVERIRYKKDGLKLALMFEGESVPLCSSGTFTIWYDGSPIHE